MSQGSQVIRTMKSDAEELLKHEQSSFIDMIAEEAKLRQKSRAPISVGPKRQTSPAKIIFGILLVVVIGAGGAAGYYFLSQKNNEPPPRPVPQGPDIPRPFINAQKTDVIKIPQGDRTGLLSAFGAELLNSRKDTNFWYLPLVVTESDKPAHIATPTELFQTLRITPASGDFFDGIENRWNLYAYGEDLIFVFTIRDRSRVQGAMLLWERTLPQQLSPLIAGSKATPRMFEDKIIKNNDARIATLPETTIHAVAYSVGVSGTYLVITTSEAALRATIDRLTSG